MKNTDPPHHSDKTAKLTPDLSKFIEGMGMYFENQGVPRIGGRILALLMISHEPLSAENLASILKVSRASISTNMRILTQSELVGKVSMPGERTTFFEFTEHALERTIVSRIQSSMTFRKLVDQGLSALNTQDFARHRLESAITWTDMLVETFEKALAEWHTLQQSAPEKKNHNKPLKLTDASRIPVKN